jgi:hypothetical protein
MRNLTKEEVVKALANDAWDLGNQVLYDLCSQYPQHKSQKEILAKIWLIGRSYAAALERRKNRSSDSIGDLFYEDKAFPKIKNSEIDRWIGSLKDNSKPEESIEAHFKLTKLFHEISELEKRSLASKYLHFHQPNLFFIYDSRAVKAIRQITPANEKQLPNLLPIEKDTEYLKFFRRCLWLRDELENKLERKPSPREIDKILLVVADNRL